MKKMLVAAALLFASFMPAYAILSPLNQSVKEMQDILGSPEITQNLPQGETIQALYHLETGYVVFTNHYQFFVEVQYIKQNRPGPRAYQLIFHKPTKLTSEQ